MASWGVRLRGFDQRVFLAVLARRTRRLAGFMRGVTVLGDPAVIVILTSLLAIGVVPGTGVAGRHALVVLVLSHLLAQVVKRLATRPRPRLPIRIESLVQAPDRFSFPSGHATAGLAVALPLAASLPPVAAAPIVFLGIAIGLSRCYLGIHYPGDVIVGWFLAVMTWAAVPPGWLY